MSAASPNSGTVQHGEHVLRLRIYYEDTDAGGIVYHSNYLKFAERARTEMLRLIGISQRELLEREGIAFAVRSLSIDYLRPARLDDAVTVRSRLLESRGASLTLEQRIRRENDSAAAKGADEDLARICVRVACIRRDGRPGRMPPGVKAAFAAVSQKGKF